MTQPPLNSGDQNPYEQPDFRQQAQPPSYVSQSPKAKRKKWPWIVGAVAVLFIVIGLAGGGGGEEKKSETAAPQSTSTVTVVATAPAEPPVQTTVAEATTEEAVATTTQAAPPPPPPPPVNQVSAGQRNAGNKADDYLDISAFSRSGLIKQLEFEGFDTADATAGVDSLEVDWMEQAQKKAKEYVDLSPFSQQGLVEQLSFEGFTQAQAEHGAASQF